MRMLNDAKSTNKVNEFEIIKFYHLIVKIIKHKNHYTFIKIIQ